MELSTCLAANGVGPPPSSTMLPHRMWQELEIDKVRVEGLRVRERVRETLEGEGEKMKGLLIEVKKEVKQAVQAIPSNTKFSIVGSGLRRMRSKSSERLFKRSSEKIKSSAHSEGVIVIEADTDIKKESDIEDRLGIEGEEMKEKKKEMVKNEKKMLLQLLKSTTVCWAHARIDWVPSPYDSSYSLALSRGQLVRVLRKDEGGLWWAEVGGKVGRVKFVNLTITEESEEDIFCGQTVNPNVIAAESDGVGVDILLSSLGLQGLGPRLHLNGFDSLARLETLTR